MLWIGHASCLTLFICFASSLYRYAITMRLLPIWLDSGLRAYTDASIADCHDCIA